ncbi:MAG: hypothetical protein QG614_560 [Patescibacteria group bacterium]|nr:hypothetical protein [Patescibacteria group bacterium]
MKKINWQEIFVHDIEVAAFVIVSLMLAASITSYALEETAAAPKRIVTPAVNRNPVNVVLKDVNGDGVNDLLLTHEDGHKEVVITEQK